MAKNKTKVPLNCSFIYLSCVSQSCDFLEAIGLVAIFLFLIRYVKFDSQILLIIIIYLFIYFYVQVDYAAVFTFRLLMFVDNGLASGMGL